MAILLVLYLLTGIISSLFSGLLGIGGGLIIIPSLLCIFKHFHVVQVQELLHVTLGTSLASSIVNLVSSVRAHHHKGNIEWTIFRIISPAVFIGALFLGPLIMLFLSSNHLKSLFGLACIVFSLQMLLPHKNASSQPQFPEKKVLYLLGIVIGALSTLLGLAGGVMVGTLLNHYQMNMRKVVGTTAAIATVLAISGTIGLIFTGYHRPDLPEWSTGFIYWPALLCMTLASPFFVPWGAQLAQRLPVHYLKKLFALLVLVTGLQMLF